MSTACTSFIPTLNQLDDHITKWYLNYYARLRTSSLALLHTTAPSSSAVLSPASDWTNEQLCELKVVPVLDLTPDHLFPSNFVPENDNMGKEHSLTSCKNYYLTHSVFQRICNQIAAATFQDLKTTFAKADSKRTSSISFLNACRKLSLQRLPKMKFLVQAIHVVQVTRLIQAQKTKGKQQTSKRARNLFTGFYVLTRQMGIPRVSFSQCKGCSTPPVSLLPCGWPKHSPDIANSNWTIHIFSGERWRHVFDSTKHSNGIEDVWENPIILFRGDCPLLAM